MTVNYTTLLALGQPVTGTENGTWGDDVNNAVTSYLDIAIAGTLSLTGASFTAGALTLANTQGTSTATNIGGTTAQYAVLRISSLSVDSTITAPSSSRIYLVDNADATYTITIKASGQTGYTVGTNTKAWVFYNGTDYVLASTNDITKLTGTLPVANGGTGAATLTANNVILGNGTSAVQFVAPGTNGNVLTSNGTTWTSATPASSSLTGVTQSTTPFETSLGFEAGLNTTGANNTFVGYRAGKATTSGVRNSALGWNAYTAGTTGTDNVAIGSSAGAGITTGTYNSVVGVSASGGTTGQLNCAFGWSSLNQATTAYENAGAGARSLQQITTGYYNTAVGYAALQNTDTSNNNVAVGHSAGLSVSSGTQNTLIGSQAANSGTNDLTTGSNNTIIGYNAAASSSTVSNEITLGNSSVTKLRVPGVGFQFDTTDGMLVPKTITAGGTTGAQTINKTAGSVNFAAAATSLVVTNSFVDANSVIIATVGTNDATMTSVQAVAGSGSFTLYANAAATAETRVNFLVIN